MKKQIQMHTGMLVAILLLMALSACTKSRKAQLPDEQQTSVFAISEFGDVSENSKFEAKLISTVTEITSDDSVQALNTENKVRLLADDVNVPERMKFMFNNLGLSDLKTKEFKIIFSVDKDFVTAYKIVKNAAEISVLEKSIALTIQEVQLITKSKSAAAGQSAGLSAEKRAAIITKNDIKAGRTDGILLVPLFKYKIQGYGIIVRSKNELKEETAKLEVKNTEWKDATHIQLSPQTDNRLEIGRGVDQIKELKQIFSEDKVDNQVMTAETLQKRFSVAMKFMNNEAMVFTRLGSDSMYVYEVTDSSKLTENQQRLLKNKAGNQQLLSCQDKSVSTYIKSSDKNCVLVLSALIPVAYKSARLSEESELGSTNQKIQLEDVQKANSVGLVEIRQNAAARQMEVTTSGILDPNSTIKLADIKGEFFYRRTFESASNMFMGRTGTSGDMAIIRFEPEDKRIVVRNQQSLITYTGQGAKDREELMSFPVSYFRMASIDEHGNKLTIPAPVKATKENAEYAMIDWTNNTIPDSNSPLAFYAGGNCFMANSSLSVTDTDMRLATDGILNYSLSASYTVKPTPACRAEKDVNSAYWAGTYQFNFNISERISFMKHKDATADVQFAPNISSMAQAAFNFGVFTLADKVTGNGALVNRDGSEKYMPIIHDFRNGKKLRYYLGGINNPAITSPERRQLLVEASQKVIEEWNSTLKLAFKGTSLARAGEYVELVIDDKDSNGHLGDLDRNYIWLQELPAENGLLGVAQPAANPRSGTIQSANVIIYTGNTFNQTEALLKISKISRDYEKAIENTKKAIIEKARSENKTVTSEQLAADQSAGEAVKSGQIEAGASSKINSEIQTLGLTLQHSLKALELDNLKIKKALTGMKKKNISGTLRTILTKDIFKYDSKGKEINYPVDSQTFLKKLADLASNGKASNNPKEFELEVNKAFMNYGGLDENVKSALRKRSQLLDAAIQFDGNMKTRPGCFTYARNDINDQAQVLDKDPKKNQMLNFKKNVMSTLSHELGHAFGLLHNFKGSTDRANFEFKGEGQKVTGRNYSSIMDYMADIDMNYQGPGPYDAHALRAAYTGMVETIEAGKFDSINNIVAASKIPLVHFTKDTVNQNGKLRHYEQCDDGSLSESALCAQFDSGGSAAEITQNLINDYQRAYVNRNYVHDKILFGWPQKIQIINRNISLFQNIRSFLDEAIGSMSGGTGLPENQARAVIIDQLKAAKLGYNFFHELIRTPDAPKSSIMSESDEKSTNKDKIANSKRFIAVPFKYKNSKDEVISDVKIIEARSSSDIWLNKTRDKFDTIGNSYDKVFAVIFLLQSTTPQYKDDNIKSRISYIDFEQFLMGITEPSESPIINTILQVLQNDLKVGFFMPVNIDTKAELTKEEYNNEARQIQKLNFANVDIPVDINGNLADQTATSAIIGLAQSKWRSFDAFAESFKVGKSGVNQAPKDRPNVAKMGQNKSLEDTKVIYATQNAVGADALINIAAKNEFFVLNRSALFTKPLLQIYMADVAYKKMINTVKMSACAKGKEDPACKAALAKEDQVYISENADIAAEKLKADAVAQTFVAKLQELNSSGIIIDEELNKEESSTNLEHQVETVRTLMFSQFNIIMQIKAVLEATPPEKIQATRQMIFQQLNKLKAENSKLESLHLIATAYSVISEQAASINIELKDGEKLTGDLLAGLLMNTSKLEDDLSLQLPILEKLAAFSNLVDADTIGR